MPNILVLSSLLYLLVQMSTSGVCRHRPPSRPSTLSSVIPSSHNVSNSAFVLKLFNPSYSTDLNLRFIPQLKSPKLIVSLTKHLSNSFTSKTHITIRFFPPLTLLVPMNTYFLSLSLPPSPTWFFHPVFLLLCASPTPASNTLDTFSALTAQKCPEFRIMFNPFQSFVLRSLSVPSPPFDVEPPGHTGHSTSRVSTSNQVSFASHLLFLVTSLILSIIFYHHFRIAELKPFSSTSIKQWYDTTRFLHLLLPIAEIREQWLLRLCLPTK